MVPHTHKKPQRRRTTNNKKRKKWFCFFRFLMSLPLFLSRHQKGKNCGLFSRTNGEVVSRKPPPKTQKGKKSSTTTSTPFSLIDDSETCVCLQQDVPHQCWHWSPTRTNKNQHCLPKLNEKGPLFGLQQDPKGGSGSTQE